MTCHRRLYKINVRDGADDFIEAHEVLVGSRKRRMELVKHGLAAEGAKGIADVLSDRDVIYLLYYRRLKQ